MDKPETATRAYPVDVIDMDGKTVEAGTPVELLIAKVEEHELRFGLKVKDRDSGAEAEKPTVLTALSTTTEKKSK